MVGKVIVAVAGALLLAQFAFASIPVGMSGSTEFGYENNTIIVGVDYPTIQSALDAIAGSTDPYTIEVPPGTYNECLTINRSNVRIVSQVPHGAKIVAPPGSNQKPVEIRGISGFIENIVFEGFYIDGNADDQTSGKYHHGISVDYAENVHIIGNYVTKTHPYHKHDTGGSGINVYPNARRVYILNNEVNDIGDRSIQVSGEHILIENNYLHNGFDRGVSWDVLYEEDEAWHLARHVVIRNNDIENMSTGSGIKGRGSAGLGDHVENILITRNIIRNCAHGGVGLGFHQNGLAGPDGDIRVENNYIEACGKGKWGGGAIHSFLASSIEKDISIVSNTVVIGDVSDPAITFDGSMSSEACQGPCLVRGNEVFSGSGTRKAVDLINVQGVEVDGNHFYGAFDSLAILDRTYHCNITNNRVEHAENSVILLGDIYSCTIEGNYFDNLDEDVISGTGSMIGCVLKNNFQGDYEPVISLFNIPQNTFVLISPENGATVSNTPTLEWQVSSDVQSSLDHYEVWIDGINVENTRAISYNPPELPIGQHTWYIVAVDKEGNRWQSSSIFTFTVEDIVPPAPFSLRSPDNNAEVFEQTPTLEWEPSSDEYGIDHYEVWIDGINVENVPAENTSYTVPEISRGAHTWYVVVADTSGNSRVSDVFIFTVKAAEFVVENLSVSPSEVEPGEPIQVSVEVRNSGGVEGTKDVELKVNGEVVDSETVTLSPDESKTVSFTVFEDKEGTYSVEIGGLTGSFEVVKSGNPEGGGLPLLPVITGIIVVIAVIGGLIYWRRR